MHEFQSQNIGRPGRERFLRWNGTAICEGLEDLLETRRTGASFPRDPGGGEENSSLGYCTSTLMVWVAVRRAWSLVAPVTVTLCLPLGTPLNVPPKPF